MTWYQSITSKVNYAGRELGAASGGADTWQHEKYPPRVIATQKEKLSHKEYLITSLIKLLSRCLLVCGSWLIIYSAGLILSCCLKITLLYIELQIFTLIFASHYSNYLETAFSPRIKVQKSIRQPRKQFNLYFPLKFL